MVLQRCANHSIPILAFCLIWAASATTWSQQESAKKKPSMTVEAAIKALDSPRALMQEQAAIALVEAGPAAKPAVPTIIKILQREWPEVRTDLLWVLIELGPAAEDSVPILIKVSESTNFHARYLSCRALGKMGEAAKPAVPILIKLLRDDVTSVRRRAAEALGRLGDKVAPEAVEPLMIAMDDWLHPVREEAVLALGNFGALAKPALPKLKKAAASKKSSVRPEAALSFWKLTGDTDFVLPILREYLVDGDLEWEAAQVMAEMGPAAKAAVPDLIAALKQDATMQIVAAEALGRIGPGARPALPTLRRLLEHEEEDVRDVAREAIVRIEGK
jgi:HEAT repeat protein